MTNQEELQTLSTVELAKRLVSARYDGETFEYICPDGAVFERSCVALDWTIEWLEKEVREEF